MFGACSDGGIVFGGAGGSPRVFASYNFLSSLSIRKRWLLSVSENPINIFFDINIRSCITLKRIHFIRLKIIIALIIDT